MNYTKPQNQSIRCTLSPLLIFTTVHSQVVVLHLEMFIIFAFSQIIVASVHLQRVDVLTDTRT